MRTAIALTITCALSLAYVAVSLVLGTASEEDSRS